MIYKVDWAASDGAFAVPDKAVDEGLKLASGKAAKLLLYIMRRKTIDTQKLADIGAEIGISEEDAEDALSYWEQLNIICKLGTSSVASSVQTADQAADSPSPPRISPERQLERAAKMLSPKEISERVNESAELQFLFTQTEAVFGRLLNNTEQRTLIWLRDFYSIGTDLLIMIVSYCKDIGKTSISYVETIVSDWDKKDISTHEQADAEIIRMQTYRSLTSQVSSRLGINRALISQEVNYIRKWADMGMDINLIAYAYEKSVKSTQSNKISFPYMNKIISDWDKNNLRTIAAIDAADTKFVKPTPQVKNTPAKNNGEHSYDVNVLLEYAMKNTPKVKKD